MAALEEQPMPKDMYDQSSLNRRVAYAAAAECEACARLIEGMSVAEILLAAGEMTAQERRTVKAVQRLFAHKIRERKTV